MKETVMKNNRQHEPLTFGFDIGIASVGWAVLSPTRIVDMCVRCFDAAADSGGEPYNQTRRGARVSRNRYNMRSWRLKRLVRLFRDAGILSNDEIKQLFSGTPPKKQSITSPWELRSKGLTEKLTAQEWAQVIYHIVKHRGFKFFSKSEDPTQSTENSEQSNPEKKALSAAQKEQEGLKDGLTFTSNLLKKYPQFLTLGNAAYRLANAIKDKHGIYRDKDGNQLDIDDCQEFQESLRNKAQSYRHAFRRDDLHSELSKLFDEQKRLGNPYIDLKLNDNRHLVSEVPIGPHKRVVSPLFKDQVFALFELQYPPIYSDQMDALIGDCELEDEQRNGKGKAALRAAKHTFSNERATWLQTLNNLRIRRNGNPKDELTDQERKALINLPYTQNKVTFKQVREILREETGFPASWREASFTKVSYRSKRKNDGSWINVVSAEGDRTPLRKYGGEKARKETNKTLKARLEEGTITYAELREIYQVKNGELFEHKQRDEQIIIPALETQYPIPFDKLEGNQAFIKILPAKGKNTVKLSKKALNVLHALSETTPDATLAHLRAEIDNTEELEAGWQFELSTNVTTTIQPVDEAAINVPIEYEDAQQAENEILVELRGWHTLRRKLETLQPDWWNELEAAWRDAQSDDSDLKATSDKVAIQLDQIVEILTKAQTDSDRGSRLAELGLSQDQVAALQEIHFKQYRNLSLKALRNILPHLESGKSYPEACALAGYKSIPQHRTRHLPPLETYLYERVRHGKKTGYTERRYKELTNPAIARAFNQARLVLNALIDRYNQSPAYVHIELARDIAKPLKGFWSGGKYIEGRLDIDRKQKENRDKRIAARNNFIETHKVDNPSSTQMLKMRLYHEQQCKCIYSLKSLDPNQILADENYAQIDHIWPRSKTFDNSMDNLVLVHAHANQDKGNSIPYNFIIRKYGEQHWREVMAYVISCKGMNEAKRKRLLATELDADDFLARNLVDTRYITRLFARMVRERLLFDGQEKDKTDDIDPSESGQLRLNKFHKTRVRTPQGGAVSFLRNKWFGDIKDREAGDKHHAMDACVIAACSPELIHRVNSWFSNQEKIPNRFLNNHDGTYTDKSTGEIVNKREARDLGLYLPTPWDGFRLEFIQKYQDVFVARAVRKKRNNELHDANPMAWKQAYRRVRVPLHELTLNKLDQSKLPQDFYNRNSKLIDLLRGQLEKYDGDAGKAFAEPFRYLAGNKRSTQLIKSIRLPEPTRNVKMKRPESGQQHNRYTPPTAHKTVVLTNLTLDMLSENKLGTQYYRRNKRLIDALTTRLRQFNNVAEKAFDEKNPFYHPLNSENKARRQIPLAHGPVIKSIRLPKNKESGIHVRKGIAELGDSLLTEVYWTGESYFFRPRYKAPENKLFGITDPPDGSTYLFSVTQNDLVEAELDDNTRCQGYFVMYESDGRLQIRDHDQPKKNAHRFGIGKLRQFRKFKVSILGEVTDTIAHIKL